MSDEANTPPSSDQPRFQLGRPQLAVALGFVLTVLACDFALGLSPYRVLVPPQVEQNQIQLFAHTQRPEPEDVLMVGSSRVLEGIDPNLITEVLSYRPDAPVEAVRLPIQGMRSWTLSKVVRELVVPRPPTELLVIGLEARFFYFQPDETARPLGFQMLASTEDALTTDWTALDRAQMQELSLAPMRGVRGIWGLPRVLFDRTDEYVEYLHRTRGLPLVNFRELSRREFELARSLRDEIAERDEQFADQELRPFDVDTFFALIDDLETLPCRVVFVRLPVTEEFDRVQARQLADFRSTVVEPVRARGFEYYDLNDFGQLRDPSLFENPSHLNEVGRGQASRILALSVIGPAVIGEPPPGVALPVPESADSSPDSPDSPAGPTASAGSAGSAGSANGQPAAIDRADYRARALQIFARDDLTEDERNELLDALRAAAEADDGRSDDN